MTNDHNKFLGNSLVRRVPVICDGKDCFVIEVSFEPRMAESYCHGHRIFRNIYLQYENNIVIKQKTTEVERLELVG